MDAKWPISQDWLDEQANRLEAVLFSHEIEATISGGAVSPRWVRFTVDLAVGTRISSVQNLSEEIALILDAPDVRIARSGGVVAIEVPLEDPQPVHLLALLRDVPEALPPVTAVLGLSLDGSPHLLNLTAPEVTHVLVAGATGCGKTELLRSLILSLALHNRQAHFQVALVDPKQRGFAPLQGLPHLLAPIANETDEALELLTRVLHEMERRDREHAPPTPRIVVAIDEVGDLIITGEKPIEEVLVRLAQRGREAGIHIICSTQRPSADAVPSALKANLPARLVGKVASAQDALIAAGISATNAEALRGSGDFLAIVGGNAERFQAAYTDSIDTQRIIDYLQTLAGLPHDPEVEIGEEDTPDWSMTEP
jgi:S-DNA-T family DNA segregation ATPase FtsK/SpoIIIE